MTGFACIVPPVIEPVAVEDVMAEARLQVGDEIDLIETYITAARQHAEVWTERSFLKQTWELRRAGFPTGDRPIELWRGPLFRSGASPQVEPVTVSYTDTGGGAQAWTDFSLAERNQPPLLGPANGSWPSAGTHLDSVIVTYTTGYGEQPVDVPASIRLAITRLAALWFDVRLAVSAERSGSHPELPLMVTAMLAPYRNRWSY